MMIRPALLPDEYAPGYRGRIMKLNAWTDVDHAARQMLHWMDQPDATLETISYVEILSTVAGTQTNQFARDHTLLPIRGLFKKHTGLYAKGWGSNQTSLTNLGLRPMRQGAYLCPRCVEEDIDFHGFSYWRREHQLPGRFTCSKHGAPLKVANGNSIYVKSPFDRSSQSVPVDDGLKTQSKGSVVVNRYLAIMDALSSIDQPLDEKTVSMKVKRAAEQRGVYTGKGQSSFSRLSDFLRRDVDNKWLDSILPGIRNKKEGEFWSALDATVLGMNDGRGTVAYILAYAYCYGNEDEALDAIYEGKRIITKKKPLETISIDETELRSAYIECKGSHSKVAKQIGFKADKTSSSLSKIGLPPLGAIDTKHLSGLLDALLISDESMSVACQKIGIKKEDARKLILGGLKPLRTAIESMQMGKIKKSKVQRVKEKLPQVVEKILLN